LSLALTMALEKGWLTIGLALMVPGVAWISLQRPLPALRQLAAILVGLVLARIAWEPRIVGSVVQTTPIFNWILYGYGVPTAAFWLAGYLLRQRADDGPARTCDAATTSRAATSIAYPARSPKSHCRYRQDWQLPSAWSGSASARGA
jgi:uncharacterized membrane protein